MLRRLAIIPTSQSVGDVYHIKQIILTLSPQTGNSPLILAARWGHRGIVVELVKAGVKLDLQDKVQFTTPISQNQLLFIIPTAPLRMETQLLLQLQ